MKKIDWQKYIVIDPDLHHGDPCFQGTRVPVSMILGSLADGMSPEDIMSSYPQLDLKHFQAAMAYAAQLVRQEILAPLPVHGVVNAYQN